MQANGLGKYWTSASMQHPSCSLDTHSKGHGGLGF
jgi:hypothetical protein